MNDLNKNNEEQLNNKTKEENIEKNKKNNVIIGFLVIFIIIFIFSFLFNYDNFIKPNYNIQPNSQGKIELFNNFV